MCPQTIGALSVHVYQFRKQKSSVPRRNLVKQKSGRKRNCGRWSKTPDSFCALGISASKSPSRLLEFSGWVVLTALMFCSTRHCKGSFFSESTQEAYGSHLCSSRAGGTLKTLFSVIVSFVGMDSFSLWERLHALLSLRANICGFLQWLCTTTFSKLLLVL